MVGLWNQERHYVVVMCRLRPEARSRAKPSQNKPGQAGPNLWPETAFGPAWILGKPKPLAWARLCAQKLSMLWVGYEPPIISYKALKLAKSFPSYK